MISREKGTVEFPTLHTLTPEDGNYDAVGAEWSWHPVRPHARMIRLR